jgi:hypothetical protein
MKCTFGPCLMSFFIGFTTAVISGFGQSANTATIVSSASLLRPASVPQGYAITPFGYFHPSCVQRLGKGERLTADGRVQHADGSVAENRAVCDYPRYTPTGLPGSVGAAMLPEVSGWLENANVTTGSATKSYGALIATWTVPPQPVANDGQVLFFFPGLEDINDSQTSIL